MTDEIEAAKALLRAAGYVVLREKSYRAAQERQRLAQSRAEWEIDRRESAEAWAHKALDEQARLMERLTFVYGVARSLGASVADLDERRDVGESVV